MALVDYSSDSEPGQEPGTTSTDSAPPAKPTADAHGGEVTASSSAAKRRKLSRTKPSAASSTLPPLPAAFHDLYASTVRVSASDDPALHQGRKRVNPHRAGSWPTHLYIEWHPSAAERELLASLLERTRSGPDPQPPQPSVEILSFLHSDLGAPQPLHISLSRPIVLSTAQKDEFLESLVADITASGVRPFDLTPRALAWHRTPESARSFLVLRVTGARSAATATATTTKNHQDSEPERSTNPELAELLRRCNRLVEGHGQPPLYTPRALKRGLDGGGGGDNTSSSSSSLDDAFHVSVAWSFADVDAGLRARTEEAFASDPALRRAILDTRIRVDGIKAKIGNVVTHVVLPGRGGGAGAGSV